MLILNIVFVFLAVCGNECIRRRNSCGWYFWIASNTAAVIYFALTRQGWTLALFAYYLVTSVLGLMRWRREEGRARDRVTPLAVYDEAYAIYTIPAWRRRPRIRRHKHTSLSPCAQRPSA